MKMKMGSANEKLSLSLNRGIFGAEGLWIPSFRASAQRGLSSVFPPYYWQFLPTLLGTQANTHPVIPDENEVAAQVAVTDNSKQMKGSTR
jgi:hypothetical protein